MHITMLYAEMRDFQQEIDEERLKVLDNAHKCSFEDRCPLR